MEHRNSSEHRFTLRGFNDMCIAPKYPIGDAMRCVGCSAILKTPRGMTRETQKCGECRGKKHGAKKSTSRYGD